MGSKTRRTSEAHEVDRVIQEHPLWIKEAIRALRRLRVFHHLMFRLKQDEPALYNIVEAMRVDIDTAHKVLYDGNKVNQTANGDTPTDHPKRES